jgi:hypothetical protein
MAELDRVLDVLLHDLRSPLSVASGYLRLLRMERLDTFEARDKAWTHTATALTRMAHLCDEAVGFLPSAGGVRRPVAVSSLVARVKHLCHEGGMSFEDATGVAADGPVLHSPADVDQLSHAVSVLAHLQQAPDRPARVRAALHPDRRELTFVIPLASPPEAAEDAPFDPWQTPGLSAALAGHVISLASGHVRSARDLVITLPLQEFHS